MVGPNWIASSGIRFEVTTNSRGIFGTSAWVRDATTDDRHVLFEHSGAVQHVLSDRISAATGLLGGESALASTVAADGTAWVLAPHPSNLTRVTSVDTLPGAANIGKVASAMAAHPDDAVRLMLVSYVVDQADARGANIAVLKTPAGTRLLPLSFTAAFSRTLADSIAVDLRTYLRDAGSPAGLAELVAILGSGSPATRRAVLAAYDATLAALQAVDLPAAAAGLGVTTTEQTIFRARLNILLADRTAALKALGIQSP
jgi:hypothetical protein